MDIILIIFGLIFILAGIIGCVLPVIPGPPLSYVGIILLEFTSATPFSSGFMIFWFLIAAGVTVLDYIIPVWSTKKSGGSKYGTRGSMVGLIIGLFAGPVGIIIGPFLGALIGELIYGKKSKDALKSGIGAFTGFLMGTGVKLVSSGFMAYYFFIESYFLIKGMF
jgi:uncharacterized protein YqgC (DUF456 family)